LIIRKRRLHFFVQASQTADKGKVSGFVLQKNTIIDQKDSPSPMSNITVTSYRGERDAAKKAKQTTRYGIGHTGTNDTG